MRVSICQCCGQGFIPEMSGTERDHSFNADYCNCCYKNGEFIDKALTVHTLQVKLMKQARNHQQMTQEEADIIIRKLPYLKRWKMSWM